MTARDTDVHRLFVPVKSLGATTLYSCIECGSTVAEHDRDSQSPIFQARQTHAGWHAG